MRFTLLLLSAIAVAACSGSSSTTTDQAPTDPAPSGDDEATPPPADMKPLRDKVDPKIVSTLKNAGLDVASLPASLDAIGDHDQLIAVMNSFTIALGVDCDGCHVDDFDTDTPKKKVARKMYTSFVKGLTKKDGGAIFCDNCHQGKMEFLDRKDIGALETWMQQNFVDKLARKDKKEHGCPTCHGDPWSGDFLDAWKK